MKYEVFFPTSAKRFLHAYFKLRFRRFCIDLPKWTEKCKQLVITFCFGVHLLLTYFFHLLDYSSKISEVDYQKAWNSWPIKVSLKTSLYSTDAPILDLIIETQIPETNQYSTCRH